MKLLLAASAAIALMAAAPTPTPSAAPSPSPSAGATVTVICARAPLYVFLTGTDRPTRARTFAATQGERFALVSGPRTTLESREYYETDIPVTEPGYPPGTHYWISRDCAVASR